MAQPLSQVQLDAIARQVRADPNVAAILADPRYSTPMLRHQAVNTYLMNDPRAARYGLNTGTQSPERGAFDYKYDPETGRLTVNRFGPQHWYTDPASKGFQALAGAAIGAGAGMIPGLPGYQPGAYGGYGGAAKIAAAEAPAEAARRKANGGGGNDDTSKGLLDNLLSGRGLASMAALIPILAQLRNNANAGPFGAGKAGEDIVNEIRTGLEGQRKRFDATGPAFQTAQNMALGMAPVRYRASGPFGG